jgi:putative transposase
MERDAILERILSIFKESRETYGCPRMYDQLAREGYKCSYNTVERIMKANGVRPRRKSKVKRTTDSRHEHPIAANVLDRDFKASTPDEVWVSDITYINTAAGWLYLAVFIDLYSRMIVGWSMSNSITDDLVIDAFEMGLGKRGRAPIVCHSDRGSQYASKDFRSLLKSTDTIRSMSRKGNCWDNAVSESFFGKLKTEEVYRNFYKSQMDARDAIFSYIEIFFNKQRRNSAIGYLTPEEKIELVETVA